MADFDLRRTPKKNNTGGVSNHKAAGAGTGDMVSNLNAAKPPPNSSVHHGDATAIPEISYVPARKVQIRVEKEGDRTAAS